jgi:hypothetical protein
MAYRDHEEEFVREIVHVEASVSGTKKARAAFEKYV